MTAWNYLVPKYSTSPWFPKSDVPRYSTDLEWPRVSIYCPHEPHQWLLGSFVVSDAVLQARDEVLWTWRRDYPTGDGYLIQLGRNSDDDVPFQSIVDDRPYDREKLSQRLADAVSRGGFEDVLAASREIAAEMDHADATMRSRVSMRCGECGLSRTFRVERVEPILSTLWRWNIRELDLATFARRVDGQAPAR